MKYIIITNKSRVFLVYNRPDVNNLYLLELGIGIKVVHVG